MPVAVDDRPATNVSPDEIMTVAAARELRNGASCFVGIGVPSLAANLARRTHAPDLTLIYESGAIGAKPRVAPMSIGDGELAVTADAVVSVPEIFAYWLQAGRVDIGFLGAAQLDRFANINTTVIGSYEAPTVRLPGAGGAPEIAADSGEVIIVMRQNRRTFVDRLDFITSLGNVGGETSRARLGLRGAGPRVVVTDLGILRPDPESLELVLTDIHPGVDVAAVQDNTGWPLQVSDALKVTAPPSQHDLTILREIKGETT